MENISQSRWYLLQLPAVYSKSRSKEDSSINKHISWYHQSVTNSPVTPLPKIIVYQLPRRSQRASGRRVALGLQEWFLSGDIAPDFHWKNMEKWWWSNCLDDLGILFPDKPVCGFCGQGCQGTPGRSHDIPGNATAPLWCVVQCLNPLPERYQTNVQNPFAASRPLLSDFCIFLGNIEPQNLYPDLSKLPFTRGRTEVPWSDCKPLARNLGSVATESHP